MLRIVSFCLVILLAVGIIIPFANSAHGVRQSTEIGKSVNRRHSKAWWRRHRARLRRKRAAELARRQMLLALPQTLPVGESASIVMPAVPQPANTTQPELSAPTAMVQPTTAGQPNVEMKAPPAAPAVQSVASAHTVSNLTPAQPVASATSNPSLKPKSKNAVPGQMNLAVVAMSRPNPAFLTSREEAKMLAGVNVTDLRRIVIDKMVVAGGWVTNDFVRDVNGSRVFVVTARTPRDSRSPEKVWTFYFTEVAGRIYGLTTDTGVEGAEKMTTEAERFITNLRSNPPANRK